MPSPALLLRLLLSLSLVLNGLAAVTMPIAMSAITNASHASMAGKMPSCHDLVAAKAAKHADGDHASGCGSSACTCHCANLLPATIAVLFLPHRLDVSPVRLRAIDAAFVSATAPPALRPPIA